jgi:hypothetical protein
MKGKRFLLILLTALLGSSAAPGGWSLPGSALAYERDVDDVSVFYHPLEPYGTWIMLEGHGRVWIPRGVRRDWRPYTTGQWVYTEVGWTWVSEEAWGWAPFHYGRWDFSPRYGWYWVPGTVWGPAWVSWRRSPGWVGWAPLPPRGGWHADIGLGAVNIGVDISPHWFAFVEERYVLAPRVQSHFVPLSRNVHLVQVTKNVTNYTVINKTVVNHSIDVQHIERVTRRPVVQHRLVDTDAPARARGPRVRGKERDVVLVRPAAVPERRDDADRALRERQEQARERTRERARAQAREPRNDGRPGVSEDRQRREHDRQRSHEPRALDRPTFGAQQRQQQGIEEERRRQQGAERQAPAEAERRTAQQWRRDPGQAQQEAPRSRATEVDRRRDSHEHQQHIQREQDVDRRRQPSAEQDDSRTSRDRRSMLHESQRPPSSARPRGLMSAERPERHETGRRAGQEEERTRQTNTKSKAE